MTRAEKWRTVGQVVAIFAPLCAVGGLVPGYFLGDGGIRSIVAGSLISLLIAAGMVTFEVSWTIGLVPRQWREAPFLVVLVTRSLVWLLIIVVGIGVPLLTVAEVSAADLFGRVVVLSVVISFVLGLVINFVGQVNRLLGRGVLVSLVIGRYHRPREEVRIFLFLDLRGSSQIAERLGNLRYHSFLKRFISDVTGTAFRFGAEVHRYVGDEIIFTWDERRGLSEASCVQSVFAMASTLEAAADEYVAEFGEAPSFWAALHMGPVVTGDIGSVKHEIAYLGDTLNVAARIEEACKELQRPFLASGDVVNAVDLPSPIEAENLGPIELRGIGASVELFALSRRR